VKHQDQKKMQVMGPGLYYEVVGSKFSIVEMDNDGNRTDSQHSVSRIMRDVGGSFKRREE